MVKDKDKQVKNINVNASTFRGSVYSQLASVTVTDLDVTLEFVYVNPRDTEHGEVVSRVTMPLEAGEQLSGVISEIVKRHKSKQGRK